MTVLPFDYAAHGLLGPVRRPAIPGGPQTVAEILDHAVARAPERAALVDRHTRLTYGELDRAAWRAAAALTEIGVRPWDRIAVALESSTELVVLLLATMRLGAIWVGVNRALAPREKTTLLRAASAAIFVGDDEQVAQVRGGPDGVPGLDRVLVVEPGARHGEWARLLATASDRACPRPIDPHAPAAIAFTSGTTGLPKGAVHSQHNLLLPGAVMRARGIHGDADRIGCVLPLTILNLAILGPLTAFQLGACCVLLDRTDPLGLAAGIGRERVTTFAGVPTLVYDLLRHPDVRAADLATLGPPLIGGADLPPALRALYRERFGVDITVGYGMTEAPTAVTMTEPDQRYRAGLCGRPLPQVDVFAVDDAGCRLPRGAVGEVCVAPASVGPWAGVYTPMLGYWNDAAATGRALVDGAYHSGDLGALAEDGSLVLAGRRSDLILRGGANVYPAEIERVLLEDARVAACAVLGAPDERLGERVVAFVALVSGARATAAELLALCAANLARYKVPAELRFVDDFPRNSMGKIRKSELARTLATAERGDAP
jgi:acyl-CoA synthetase (AMP-forming)/AMP-acid ligase II